MNSIDQVRKRFVLYAAVAIFVLLTVLLATINVVNFTMASEDADQITQTLANHQGAFDKRAKTSDTPSGAAEDNATAPPGTAENSALEKTPSGAAEDSATTTPDAAENAAQANGVRQGSDNPLSSSGEPAPPKGGRHNGGERGPRVGPMGPESPEMAFSTRYFTYAFDHEGNARQIAFQISAVTQEEAQIWADSLRIKQQIGWTRTTYRYRVYHAGGLDYVTVIDQGRELLPSLRILIISISGEILGLLISSLALLYVSKRLFQPLEEADRKQKRFISEVEKKFKVPLTVIHAAAELVEQENGESDQSRAIHRQVKRMEALVKDLSALSVFDAADLEQTPLPLSELANAAADGWREEFSAKGVALRMEVENGVVIRGDGESIAGLLDELLRNALKFGKTRAALTVKTQGDRVLILAENDADLPDGNADQVFDRFTRLDNAKDMPGVGLGLFRVKEVVRLHNGRVSAKAADGVFTVRLEL